MLLSYELTGLACIYVSSGCLIGQGANAHVPGNGDARVFALFIVCHSVGTSWQSDWTRAEHGLLGPGIEGAELIHRKCTYPLSTTNQILQADRYGNDTDNSPVVREPGTAEHAQRSNISPSLIQ